MPTSWHPPGARSTEPWTAREALEATRAVESALAEILGYFADHPAAIESLWDDSVEALVQPTYASANRPDFDERAQRGARQNLSALIGRASTGNSRAHCDDTQDLLPLALFAANLYPRDDPRTTAITRLANAAMGACSSIEAMTGFDIEGILADQEPGAEDIEDLFAMHLWALWLFEAQVHPQIELPPHARRIASRIWPYLKTFPLADAWTFDGGAQNRRFRRIADLAIHLAHIPTGVHRYPISVAHYPDLYRFHRENFYAVLELGDPDLLASFVDSLRQYGCTPETDAQVRDGVRGLLRVFREGGGRWIAEPIAFAQGGGDPPNHYATIHRPWTAMLGLRDRRYEHPGDKSYDGVFRRSLKPED